MTHTVAVLRGDGIGPEVVEAGLSVLAACVPIRFPSDCARCCTHITASSGFSG